MANHSCRTLTSCISYSASLVTFTFGTTGICLSGWPRRLMRGSAVACLLGWRVRIPPGAWMSVLSVVWFHVDVSATDWSLVQRSPTKCVCLCVCVCVWSLAQQGLSCYENKEEVSGLSRSKLLLILGTGVPVRNLAFTFDFFCAGWYSSVGIATHLGLEGPGIESQWGWDFPHSSGPALWPTQLPVQ